MEYRVGDKVRLKKTIACSDGVVLNGIICMLAETSGLISEIIDPLGRKWTIATESIEPVIPTIGEIISKEMSCVIHTKTKEEAELLADYMPQTSSWSRNPCDDWDYYGSQTGYYIADGKLAQYASISYYEANFPEYGEIYEFSDLFATDGVCSGFRGGKIPTPSKPVSIEEQLGLPKGVSIHDLPTTELIKKEFNVTWIDKIALPTATETKEMVERVRREILKFTNAFPKEEKKMSTKFTFYVTEGTRPDKSCNGLIPTMTTTVVDASGKKTTVTCDKTDYSERQGVLEAIAQIACGGNFDKEYDKAIKKNKLVELHDRTCTYCGKVFDTIAEREAHEKWHVERKKARRERYLLRKRAKEIAFEEQAQKMAKEMMEK